MKIWRMTVLAIGLASMAVGSGGKSPAYPEESRITKGSARHLQPCWLSDGKIAYLSDQEMGDSIWIANADGSNPKRIQRTAPKAVDTGETHPTQPIPSTGDFHPNGAPGGKIVFVGQMVGANIFVMNEDGSNRVQLTKLSTEDTCPSCNGDGKIVFASDRDHMGRGSDIYTMDLDGSNIVRLTHDSGNNTNPSWSPDGKRIAFQSNRGGNGFSICTMDADGSNQKEIAGQGYTPSWGPDGRIAFVSERTKVSPEIFIMNSDGSGVKQLTNNKVKDYWPKLGPNGKIIYQSAREIGGQTRTDIYMLRAPG